MIDLHGTYTALVTPFTEDGAAPDLDRLAAAVTRQGVAGVRGVVPCGTTGETPTLEAAEYEQVIERTVEAARPAGLQVIAGAGANATARAIAQHRFVASAGVDAALHVTPYYNRPSAEGLYRHFMAIAEASDLPIVVYVIPGRTGLAVTAETLIRIARHPNIVALKDATGGLDLAARTARETDLVVLSGDDPLTLPLATVGARGVISVLSNVVPDRVAALTNALGDDDWSRARTISDRWRPLATALLTLDSNPVPVKAALELLGHDTGVVRLPLTPLGETARARLHEMLEAYDLRPRTVLA